jgi:hypothetical protein
VLFGVVDRLLLPDICMGEYVSHYWSKQLTEIFRIKSPENLLFVYPVPHFLILGPD